MAKSPIYPTPKTGLLVIVAQAAILPGYDDPEPVTVEIDKATGTISEVLAGELKGKGDYEQYGDDLEYVVIPEGSVLMPGMVDAHVHLNAPGRSAWEGHHTGTLAAISGGVTTLIDMPLNSLPPTTTVDNLEAKLRMARFGIEPGQAGDLELQQELEAIREQMGTDRMLDVMKLPRLDSQMGGVWCDLGFWGGLLPTNREDLVELLDHGVKGFKCFMIDSGVVEFPHVETSDIRAGMDVLRGTGSVILYHAEQGTPTNVDHHPAGKQSYERFMDSRPPSLELSAIQTVIDILQEQANSQDDPEGWVRAHIVHLATAEAVPMIEEARAAGLPLSIETTFHYLCTSAEHVPHTPTPSTEYKCCPPLRSESNREALWDALENGVIDYVVSDHSPCTPDLKNGGDEGFMRAWGGISALGLGLSLMWTETKRRNLQKAKGELEGNEVGLARISDWCATKTAEQVGLAGKKGEIIKGADADFLVFDPESTFEVSKESLKFRNKISCFIGQTLYGVVQQTYLRGMLVWDVVGGRQGDRLGELL